MGLYAVVSNVSDVAVVRPPSILAVERGAAALVTNVAVFSLNARQVLPLKVADIGYRGGKARLVLLCPQGF